MGESSRTCDIRCPPRTLRLGRRAGRAHAFEELVNLHWAVIASKPRILGTYEIPTGDAWYGVGDRRKGRDWFLRGLRRRLLDGKAWRKLILHEFAGPLLRTRV